MTVGLCFLKEKKGETHLHSVGDWGQERFATRAQPRRWCLGSPRIAHWLLVAVLEPVGASVRVQGTSPASDQGSINHRIRMGV